VSHLEGLLAEIQQSLYDRALRFRKEHTFKASNMRLKDAVERGFVLCYWAGTGGKASRKKPRPPFASFHWSNPLNLKCILTGKDTPRSRSFSHVPIDSKYCQSELAG